MASTALERTVMKEEGFSLTEMVVVVAIVGILAGIAWPSYMKSVMKSNRTDAKTELLDYAQRVQRCFTATGKYNASSCSAMNSLSATDGAHSRGGFYNLSATDVTETAYSLQASPVANSTQSKDKDCAVFVLDQTGKKSARDTYGNDKSEVCW